MTAIAHPISVLGTRWTQVLRVVAVAVAVVALCVAAFVAGRATKPISTRSVTTVVQPASIADPHGVGCVMPRVPCG